MPLPLLLLAVAAPSPPAPAPCRADQLQLTTEGGGEFNGMSHSGAWLVVRNRSGRACTLPALPKLVFKGTNGRVLPITPAARGGPNPGPPSNAVRLAPGARAAAALRWVSGPVYDHGRCFTPAALAITTAGGTVQTRLTMRICGPATGATVEQPTLQLRSS